MERLFSGREATLAGWWPVAPEYRIWQGTIYPLVHLDALDGPASYLGIDPKYLGIAADALMTTHTPLGECDSFLSFARLAARGEPSADAVLNWVHKYGLLRLRDKHSPSDVYRRDDWTGFETNILNQEPMTLESFRREVRRAYALLSLFEMVRASDARGLRERMTVATAVDASGEPTQGPLVQRLVWSGVDLWITVGGDGKFTDDDLLRTCWHALGNLIEPEISEVRPKVTPYTGLTLSCPDLRTAMYWQFACLVVGKRPTDFCEGCGGIFVKTRSNKKVCDDKCRKRKQRKGGATP